jgi:hypothetical protein
MSVAISLIALVALSSKSIFEYCGDQRPRRSLA